MAKLTCDFPDGQLKRILDAFGTAYGYQEKLPGPPSKDGTPTADVTNPESKEKFTRRIIIEVITGVVKGRGGECGADEARAAAARKVEQDGLVS
jgi:hypothetical protein